jgi:hypothetical protein
MESRGVNFDGVGVVEQKVEPKVAEFFVDENEHLGDKAYRVRERERQRMAEMYVYLLIYTYSCTHLCMHIHEYM